MSVSLAKKNCHLTQAIEFVKFVFGICGTRISWRYNNIEVIYKKKSRNELSELGSCLKSMKIDHYVYITYMLRRFFVLIEVIKQLRATRLEIAARDVSLKYAPAKNSLSYFTQNNSIKCFVFLSVSYRK